MKLKNLFILIGVVVLITTAMSGNNDEKKSEKRVRRSFEGLAFGVLSRFVLKSIPGRLAAFGIYASAYKLKKNPEEVIELLVNIANINDKNGTISNSTDNIIIEISKIEPNRSMPLFKNAVPHLMRKKRAIPAFVPIVGKYFGWAVVMATAGITTALADAKIRDKMAENREVRLARLTIECELNNYGCINGMCWYVHLIYIFFNYLYFY